MRQIVGMAGSLRHGSFNQGLIEASARIATGVHVDVFGGLSEVPLYDADLEAASPPGPASVKALREAVAAADGLLMATPEYNQSLPAVTKNAVDWLSRAVDGPSPLKGKPVAIMGASDGPWGTRYAQKELRHTLTASGALVMPQPMVFVASAEDAFAADGQLQDEAIIARIGRLLDAFERWIAYFPG